jgi:hypothetical protein
MGFFQKCLSLKDHDYKNSLDQRAKSGVARCKGSRVAFGGKCAGCGNFVFRE